MEISVDLTNRKLTVGSIDHQLSNEDIRKIKELADEDLTDAEAANVIENLIDEQILPFLETASRTITPAHIEQEIDEAFHTHLFLYHRQTA